MFLKAYGWAVLLPILWAPVELPPVSAEPTPLQHRLNEAVNQQPSSAPAEGQVRLETRWQDTIMNPDPSRRADSFGNSSVDQAPKTWPFPMVVSPGRPVLPGSAW